MAVVSRVSPLSLRLLPAAAFFLCIPQLLHAQASGVMEPDSWYIDTQVVVSGTRLQGPSPSLSKLCFAPEVARDQKVCFPAGHANILKWTSSNITFIPPKNVPPVGLLIVVHPYNTQECSYLYGNMQCKTVTKRDEVDIGLYTALPHVTRIQDAETGEVARMLLSGRKYEIKGYRFGDTGRGIYADLNIMDATDIERWSHDSILFTPPESIATGTEIRVHNGGGKSNPWLLQTGTGSSASSQSGSTQTGGNVTVSPDVIADEENPEDASGSLSSSSSSSSIGVIRFTDVDEQHPYAPAIQWGAEKGIIRGYLDGAFRPERDVSRAEFLKMLLAAKEVAILPSDAASPFSDVDRDAWYGHAVLLAHKLGLVRGYRDGTFKPDQSVTLAEALKMSYRLFAIPTLDPAGEAWYSRYWEHAKIYDILFDTGMPVNEPLSRKDSMWLLWRLYFGTRAT